MQLRYFVPFKAQEGVDGQFALIEKMLNIEGVARCASSNLRETRKTRPNHSIACM